MLKLFLISLTCLLLLSIASSQLQISEETISDCSDVVTSKPSSYRECVEYDTFPNKTTYCSSYEDRTTFYNTTKCVRDGIVRLGNKVINPPNKWCVINKKYQRRIDCVDINDGLHKAIPQDFKGCQDEGGMNCQIYIFNKDYDSFDLSYVNSEKYIQGVTSSKNYPIDSIK